MNCKDLNIKQCVFCEKQKEGYGKCWVEYFDDCLQNSINSKNLFMLWMNNAGPSLVYLYALVKHKYPQYEKLLVLS